jgi:hypothetical protein
MRTLPLVLVMVGCGGSSAVRDASPRDGDVDAPGTTECAAPFPFSVGIAPLRTITVGPGGDHATIEAAAAVATPGTAIRLLPGTHAGDQFVANLRGTAQAPIWIGGAAGTRPIVSGGANAIQLSRPAFVVIHDLEITGSTQNGINIDDAAEYADPLAAHTVVVEDVYFHDIGAAGNEDCLKISGVNDLLVLDSRFERCGAGGSGVDHVGSHRSTILRNTFDDRMGNAVQSKGGSTDHDIRENRTRITGERAFNLGGSTGFEFFRPPLSTTAPNAEARRIRLYDNLIFPPTTGTPFAFVGCIDCAATHNYVGGAYLRHFRILQETVTQAPHTFEPAARGLVANNIFDYQRAAATGGINIGASTDPGSFVYRNNLWYAADAPAQSMPTGFQAPTTGDVAGQDPSTNVPADPRAVIVSPCADAPELNAGARLDPGFGVHALACREELGVSIGPFELCPI